MARAAGEPPRPYTSSHGWVQMQIWGMGIASVDLTDDGFPEGVLDEPGSRSAPDADGGPTQPTYGDIGLKRGANATRHMPATPRCHRPPGTPSSPTPTTTASSTCSLPGKRGRAGRLCDPDPSNLLLGEPDGTFVEGAAGAGLREFDPGRGAAWRTSTWTAFSISSRSSWGATLEFGATSGRAAPSIRQRWATGSRCRRIGRREPGRHRRMGRERVGNVVQSREVTVGGGHASGELGWQHFGLGSAGEAQVRVHWPDGTIGRWQPVAANRFVIVERGRADTRVLDPPA